MFLVPIKNRRIEACDRSKKAQSIYPPRELQNEILADDYSSSTTRGLVAFNRPSRRLPACPYPPLFLKILEVHSGSCPPIISVTAEIIGGHDPLQTSSHWHLRYFQMGFLMQWNRRYLSQTILLTPIMRRSLHWWTNGQWMGSPLWGIKGKRKMVIPY